MKTAKEMIEVMQAFVEGKPIEYSPDGKTGWVHLKNPVWDWSGSDYRIALDCMPDRMMTNHELAELLTKGYGQARYFTSYNGSFTFTSWNYSPDEGDDRVLGNALKVRKWGENEWKKATLSVYREFMGIQEVEI